MHQCKCSRQALDGLTACERFIPCAPAAVLAGRDQASKPLLKSPIQGPSRKGTCTRVFRLRQLFHHDATGHDCFCRHDALSSDSAAYDVSCLKDSDLQTLFRQQSGCHQPVVSCSHYANVRRRRVDSPDAAHCSGSCKPAHSRLRRIRAESLDQRPHSMCVYCPHFGIIHVRSSNAF